jgi:hypothetical protein
MNFSGPIFLNGEGIKLNWRSELLKMNPALEASYIPNPRKTRIQNGY